MRPGAEMICRSSGVGRGLRGASGNGIGIWLGMAEPLTAMAGATNREATPFDRPAAGNATPGVTLRITGRTTTVPVLLGPVTVGAVAPSTGRTGTICGVTGEITSCTPAA